MAVLRPDQSQLTILGEVFPGADSEIIVPAILREFATNVLRGVFYTSSSTALAAHPEDGSPSGAELEAIIVALPPVLAGASTCYVNPVGHLTTGDFICFDTRDWVGAAGGGGTISTAQYTIPYIDATTPGGGCQPEIRRIERIEVIGSAGLGLIYFDRPLAFAHYCYDGSDERGDSANYPDELEFTHTSAASGFGSWGNLSGYSHYYKAAVFRTLTAGSSEQKFINVIPGVYETVDTPDFTPLVEPRYFLGTQSNRNFTSVYTGQHSFTGALNGMVLTNGWPLRFAIGKEVPKVFGELDTSTPNINLNGGGGSGGDNDANYPQPLKGIIDLGYYSIGFGNTGHVNELGLGLKNGSNPGDVWICLSHIGWNGAAIGIGHHLLIDYTDMNVVTGRTYSGNTVDVTNKIFTTQSTVAEANRNKLEIRQIVEIGKDVDGTILNGYDNTDLHNQTTWVRLNYPLRYAHDGGGANNATTGWGCRIMGYALSATDATLKTANSGTAFADTYIEHYIQETNDLDTISMHLKMRDSAEDEANDFDRRWIGGKVGSMSLVGEEGGLITCNWDSIVFLDMLHNQARHDTSTRNSTTNVQQLYPDLTGTTTSNMPGFAIMHNIDSADISFPTTKPYYFSNGSVKLLGVASSTAIEFARVRSFTLTVNNNEDPRYYIKNRPGDHRGPAEIREQRREYSLNCTVALPDTVGASSSSRDSAMSLFKELLLEGRYTETGGHHGFHIELVFSRGTIEGAPNINDEIVIKIPGRYPGETDLSGYSNTAVTGVGTQGAFLRSAPHTIMTEAPFQVTCDFVFRNIDIMIRDREPFYP